MTLLLPKSHRTTVLNLLSRINLIAVAVLTLVLVGCQATAISDRLGPTWQPTASYDYITEQQRSPLPAQAARWSSEQRVDYQAGTVWHFGSYFDDPFVSRGDGDGLYGWTWMDAAAFGYCPARFIVNTVAVPVSMIKEPPGVAISENRDQFVENQQP